MNKHDIENRPGYLQIHVLQLIREDTPSVRDRWENIWMARLFTYVPEGLNVQD